MHLQKPAVSIVVATYNREEMLCNTIENLLEQDYESFEIIIVDQTVKHNASTEKFLRELQEFNKTKKNPEIIYIKTSPPNLPRARNIGINSSKGDILIFVDDDVKISKNFITNHVANYKSNIGGVAGKVNLDPPVNFPDAHKCKDQIKDWWYLTFSTEKPGSIATAIGCNMSFLKSALTKINSFDENFTQDSNKEETDLCFRIRKIGYQIIFDPHAELTHLTSPEGGTRTTKKDLTLSSNFYRNQIYFFLKNLPKHQLPKYLILTYRYFVCREKEQLLKSPPVFSRFLKRNWAFFWGFKKGLLVYIFQRNPHNTHLDK